VSASPPASDADGRRRPDPTALRQVLATLLIAPVVIAPLAIGTVHRGTRLVVFGLCMLALAAAVAERVHLRRALTLAPPFYALAIAVVATALQLVPVPAHTLAAVSPSMAELVDGQAHAVSLDPTATARELAKLAAYLAFFLAATVYASRSPRRRTLLLVVVATAVLVAAIGFVQAAFGSDEILFLYRPHAQWSTWVRGTFVNPNNFGALMALAAPVALAWGLSEPRWRWPAFGAAFLLDGAVLMSLGRVSIVAAAAGQLLVLLLFWRGRKTHGLWVAGAVLVAAGAAVVAVGRARLEDQVTITVQELEDIPHRQAKLQLWANAAPLIAEFPWTGVGRGAFEPAFQRISPSGGSVRYEWVENAYLEAPIDWGVPVALALYVAAGWAFVRLVRRRNIDEPLVTGALAGIVALAVHEIGDFAVELPGVALPGLVALAALYRPREDRDATRVPARAAMWALPVILALPLMREAHMPTADEDGAAVAELARNPLVPPAQLVAASEAAHRRHPADAYIPTVTAERLEGEHDPAALRWINLAMARNPAHPIPHLLAAEFLARSGRKSQALVEYRLAAAGALDPRTVVFPRVRARYPALDDLLAATPQDARGLTYLAKWLRATAPADAEAVYARLVGIAPGSVIARRELAALALDRRDAAAAGERVRALLEVDHSPIATRLAVRERILAGDYAKAARILDGANDRSPEAFELELRFADELSARGGTQAARARLDRLVDWGLTREQRAHLHEVRAENERRAGNEHQYRWELGQRDRWRTP
jgi:O-antigen ligase